MGLGDLHMSFEEADMIYWCAMLLRCWKATRCWRPSATRRQCAMTTRHALASLWRSNFDGAGRVTGASINTYLLERSRVISVNAPERSYHIFLPALCGRHTGASGACTGAPALLNAGCQLGMFLMSEGQWTPMVACKSGVNLLEESKPCRHKGMRTGLQCRSKRVARGQKGCA